MRLKGPARWSRSYLQPRAPRNPARLNRCRSPRSAPRVAEAEEVELVVPPRAPRRSGRVSTSSDTPHTDSRCPVDSRKSRVGSPKPLAIPCIIRGHRDSGACSMTSKFSNQNQTRQRRRAAPQRSAGAFGPPAHVPPSILLPSPRLPTATVAALTSPGVSSLRRFGVVPRRSARFKGEKIGGDFT